MKRCAWGCSDALIALLVVLLALPSGALAQAVRIERADFLLSDSPTMPPDAAAWQPVPLSDDWRRSRAGTFGFAWYRLRFALDAGIEPPYALYVPRVRAAAAFHLNGQLIGRTGPFDPVDHANRMPQLFTLPSALLQPGENEVQIRLRAVPAYWNGLAPVTIGPDSLLRQQFERRRLLQVTGPQLSFALTALFGLFSLLLWWRRRESMYIWFGLSMLCFAAFTTFAWVRVPPLPPPWWSLLTDLSGPAKMLFLALFALRFAERRWLPAERAMWIVMAAFACSSLLISLGIRHWTLDRVFDVTDWLGWRMFSVVCIAALATAAWKQRDAEHILVALTAAVHPLVEAWFDYVSPPDFATLMPVAYDFIPMLLVIAWVLVDRFVKSLKALETLNVELEQRVEAKHAELQANYKRLHVLEQQQAVVAERARIMSDMHDGIGGQLISTLSLVEHGEASKEQVAAALRECIDDLRLAIDSLQPTDDDLLPVLGNLRYRLEPRLKARGIALDWQVQDVPRLACLTPQNVLHVLRIVQEAFTNVLKHAQATRISVKAQVEDGGVAIRVSDNGKGFTGDPAHHGGHGLGGMAQRARAIGADLRVQPSSSGTTVALLLPGN